MLITNNNLSNDRLVNNPIFLLTGDIETTKFFSSLASACIKLGYYIEDLIISNINLPILEEIGQKTLFPCEQYILIKPKFGKEIPDIVFIDENRKQIQVFEIKTNLRNADSKKAHGEKAKYKRLYDFLIEKYLNYKVEIFVVDFLGSLTGATELYRELNIINVVSGKNFCNKFNVDYQLLMDQIKSSQKLNRNFIQEFKRIEIY